MRTIEEARLGVLEAMLTANWYRLSRYENVNQAQNAIRNIARDLERALEGIQ